MASRPFSLGMSLISLVYFKGNRNSECQKAGKIVLAKKDVDFSLFLRQRYEKPNWMKIQNQYLFAFLKEFYSAKDRDTFEFALYNFCNILATFRSIYQNSF